MLRASLPWLALVGALGAGCRPAPEGTPLYTGQPGYFGPPGYAAPSGYYGPPAYYGAPAYSGQQGSPPVYGAPAYGPAPAAPAPPAGALAAVSFAQSKLGLPYCWGGNGPACYDCSGLTHAAWTAGGKSIPRTSEAQVEGLPAVPLGQVQPGDILWRPGHVGLYAGGGWVIAATQTGDVIRYQKASGYVKAVRP